MNPVDWGNTPLANGAVRGVLAALLFGVIAGIARLQQGFTVQDAAITGAAVALPAFLALLGYGSVDQNRANQGVVNPADVPVQIESRLPVMGDSGLLRRGEVTGRPAKRDAKTIAREWTRNAKVASGGR